MKKIIWVWVILLVEICPSWGQTLQNIQRIEKKAERIVLPVYQYQTQAPNYFQVDMYFEQAQVFNEEALEKLPARDIVAIDLVYTLFPEEKDFTDLNRRRLQELEKLFPTLLSKANITWRFVGQSQAKSREAAKQLFHGFVIYHQAFQTLSKLSKPHLYPVLTSGNQFSGEEMDYGDLDILRAIYLQQYLPPDSTVFKIFERNQKRWGKTAVIIDWTGSMYSYGAQVLTWLQLRQEERERFRHFVFFNDGDDKVAGQKVIGATGGIYASNSGDFEEIIQTMYRTQANGQGGYNAENDLEALLYGQRFCPDCENFILIADAQSSIRDLVLLPRLINQYQASQQKLSIILCGASSDMLGDYLYLATQTQGSIHTIQEDIHRLDVKEEGRVFHLFDKDYQVSEGYLEYISPAKAKRLLKRKR